MEHLVVEPVEPGGSAAAEVEQLNVITAPDSINFAGSTVDVRNSWADFKKEWARYSSALFLSLVGNEALEIYNKMHFSDGEDKNDLQAIVKKFDGHFYGEAQDQSTLTVFDGRDEVNARFRFHSRRQQLGESVASFVEDVKRLARDCQFCSCQHELLIRDRIVAGVINEETRSELLKVSSLSLQICIDICKIAESFQNRRRNFKIGDKVMKGFATEQPVMSKLPIPRDPQKGAARRRCETLVSLAAMPMGMGEESGGVQGSGPPLEPGEVAYGDEDMGEEGVDVDSTSPESCQLSDSTSSAPNPNESQLPMVMVVSDPNVPHVTAQTVTSSTTSTADSDVTCKVCGLVVGRSKDMKRHLETHAKTWPCKYCGQEIQGFIMWQKHSVACTQRKCNVCGKKFVKAYHLARHVKIHAESRDYACELCGKAFKQQSSLYNHKRSAHFHELMVFCDICGQGCISQLSLEKHRTTHFPVFQPVKCNLCGKVFSKQRHLDKHEQVSHAEKKFSCPTCPKKFSCQRYLDIHSRIHSGERPYACRYCPKRFISDTSLLYHERRHTGITPHVCTVCNKRFVNTSHLKTHMTRHHGCNGSVTSEASGMLTSSGLDSSVMGSSVTVSSVNIPSVISSMASSCLTSTIDASAISPTAIHPSLVQPPVMNSGVITQTVITPAIISPTGMNQTLVSPSAAHTTLVSGHLTNPAIMTSNIHPTVMNPSLMNSSVMTTGVISQNTMNLNKPSSDEQAVFLAGVQNFATNAM